MGKSPVRFALEGGVAAGKSSLLRYIQLLRPEWNCVQEPVETWRNYHGRNYLDEFYDNRSREACIRLQEVIIQSYIDLHLDSQHSGSIQLFERSAFSAVNVFSRAAEYLNEDDRKDLVRLYNENAGILRMDNFIYLRTPPEICYERKIKRDHINPLDPNGQVLTPQYAQVVHDCHEKVFGYHARTTGMIIDEFVADGDACTIPEKARAVIRYIEDEHYLEGVMYTMGGYHKRPSVVIDDLLPDL